MAATASEQHEPSVETQHRREHRRRKKHRWAGVPAPYVFYALALVGLAGMGAVYVLGKPFIPVAGAACLLLMAGLYVNDNKGFIRRRQMRRAFEARRNFNNLEIIVLIVLVMGNFFVSALALLG